MRLSLTAFGVLAGVSMFCPPAVIPLAILVVIVTAVMVWHLWCGGRVTVRRTAKGNFTFTLDSVRQNPGPHIGATSVLFVVLLAAILGGLMRLPSGTGVLPNVGTMQGSEVHPAKAP